MSHQNYLTRYLEFLTRRKNAKGYDFHEIWPPVSASQAAGVSTSSNSSEKLPWWSLRRRKHMKKVRAERDRRQQNIIKLRNPPGSRQPPANWS